MVPWLEDLVPGLSLVTNGEPTPFYTVFKNVSKAMPLIEGAPQVSELRTVRQRTLSFASNAYNWIVAHKGYAHADHGPLIIALLDEDNPLSYEALRDLYTFCSEKRNEGNEAAHGPLPEPDEYFPEMVKELRIFACGGSMENPLFQKIKPWTERYRLRWPNNTPTKLQRRYPQTPLGLRQTVASSELGLQNHLDTPESASDNSDGGSDEDLHQQDDGGHGGALALLPLLNAVASPQRSA